VSQFSNTIIFYSLFKISINYSFDSTLRYSFLIEYHTDVGVVHVLRSIYKVFVKLLFL